MNKLKSAAVGIAGLSLLGVSTASFAEPTLDYTTTNYGAFSHDPFGGFDWNAAASAVTAGFNPDGTTVFTTEYWADAVAVVDTNGTSFASALQATGGFPAGAEFTIHATITETAVALSANVAEFTATGGSFTIYYDPLANANLTTGAGIKDGTPIISGEILPGVAGVFVSTGGGTGGTGTFEFKANVTSTDNAFINPDLLASNAVSTIQFGSSTTNWSGPPTSTPSGGIPAGALLFQADGNQAFSIPEPGTIGLIGLGLLGLSRIGRRRKGNFQSLATA